MAKLIDFEARRQAQKHKQHDARTAELRDALALGREAAEPEHSKRARATRKLLALYQRKKSDNPR